MLLGTLALIPAATTRPPLPGTLLFSLGMFGVPEAMFIAALMSYDLRTVGTVHHAAIWAAGAVLVGAVSRWFVSHTAMWIAFARE